VPRWSARRSTRSARACARLPRPQQPAVQRQRRHRRRAWRSRRPSRASSSVSEERRAERGPRRRRAGGPGARVLIEVARIPLGDYTRAMLARMSRIAGDDLVEHLDRLRRVGQPVDPDACAVPNRSGGRMSRQRVARIVGDAARHATSTLTERGLPPLPTVTPHSLRRTSISMDSATASSSSSSPTKPASTSQPPRPPGRVARHPSSWAVIVARTRPELGMDARCAAASLKVGDPPLPHLALSQDRSARCLHVKERRRGRHEEDQCPPGFQPPR
jgi:hypothetical protein